MKAFVKATGLSADWVPHAISEDLYRK